MTVGQRLPADSASEPPDWIADARVIPEAYDSDVDLAVIQLVDIVGQPTLSAGRDPIEIKDIGLGLGDEIKVLGYPGLGGDTITMTGGEISGWLGDYYKSSARSGPGVSGGAAFDSTTGEYVGTPSGGSSTDVGEALVLVRPSSYALPLLQAAQQADLPPAPTTTTTTTQPPVATGTATPCGDIGSIAGIYPVGDGPKELVFDGDHIWVSNYHDDTVTKLRASDGEIIGTYPVDENPDFLAFDGEHIWVTHRNDDTVTKLRASDGENIGTYPAGGTPEDLVFDGIHIWVSTQVQDFPQVLSVSKLRASDGVLLDIYPVTGTYGGQHLMYDRPAAGWPNGYIWVTREALDEVGKVRLSDGVLVDSYPAGNWPGDLVFDGKRIWITSWIDDTVSVFWAATWELLGTIPVGDNPQYLAFDGTNVWVSSFGDDSVSKLRGSKTPC